MDEMNRLMEKGAVASYFKIGRLVPSLLNLVIFSVIFGNSLSAIINELFGVSSHPLNITFKAVASIISILLILIALWEKKFVVSYQFIYFSIICLLSFLFLLYSYIYLSYSFIHDIKTLIGISVGAIIFPVSAIILSSKKVPRIDHWLFFWTFAVCLTFVFCGDTFAFDPVAGKYVDTGRLHLTSLNPISTGTFGGYLVLLAIFKWHHHKSTNILILLAGLLGLYILTQASSRSPILGVLLALLLIFFIKRSRLILFLSPVVLFVLFYLVAKSDENRLMNISDPSILIRFRIYEIYLAAISDNFAFPIVPLDTSLVWAHNIVLGVYSSSTILGVILFIILLMHCFGASIRLISRDCHNGWVGLFFVLVFTISFFSGALLDFYFWIISALVIAYSRQKNTPYVGN